MKYPLPLRFVSLPLLSLLLATSVNAKSLPLTSAEGLTLHHAAASSVTFKNRTALRLVTAEDPARTDGNRLNHLAILDGLNFGNGTIEVDVAGSPSPGASGGARGFVGVAFRVQPDRSIYDCFYLRPTNGRSEDQERRNHSLQYISHPDHTWFKFRQETPSRYETYVDITPSTWIHLRIEVEGEKARIFVDNRDQPSLIINDVKSGTDGTGDVALWFEGSTVAHFANLKVTPR
jgi:hypothetical protein